MLLRYCISSKDFRQYDKHSTSHVQSYERLIKFNENMEDVEAEFLLLDQPTTSTFDDMSGLSSCIRQPPDSSLEIEEEEVIVTAVLSKTVIIAVRST